MSRRSRTNEATNSGYSFVGMLGLLFIPLTGAYFICREIIKIVSALIEFVLALIDGEDGI